MLSTILDGYLEPACQPANQPASQPASLPYILLCFLALYPRIIQMEELCLFLAVLSICLSVRFLPTCQPVCPWVCETGGRFPSSFFFLSRCLSLSLNFKAYFSVWNISSAGKKKGREREGGWSETGGGNTRNCRLYELAEKRPPSQ